MENNEIIKKLIENGVFCLKIENKKGEILEAIYLNDNGTTVSYVNNSIEKTLPDNFIDIFKRIL